MDSKENEGDEGAKNRSFLGHKRHPVQDGAGPMLEYTSNMHCAVYNCLGLRFYTVSPTRSVQRDGSKLGRPGSPACVLLPVAATLPFFTHSHVQPRRAPGCGHR